MDAYERAVMLFRIGVTIEDILTIAIGVTWILQYYCDSVGTIATVLQ